MQDVAAPRGGFLATAFAALTLREEAYRRAQEDPGAFRRGLVFVLLVGLIVAVAGLIGAFLTSWVSPDMAALKQAILDGMRGLPWQKNASPAEVETIQQAMQTNMDIVFGIIQAVVPTVPRAAAGLVTGPLGLLLWWLVFGLLAHGFARLLSGTGRLAGTYGATALAAAPYLLGVVHALPSVQTAGLGTWSLVCAYVAIKSTHGLSPARAFWATALPLLALAAVAVALGVAGGIVAALVIGQLANGGAAPW